MPKTPAGIRAIAFDWGGIFTEGTFDSSAVKNLAVLCGLSEEELAEIYYPLMAEFEVGAFDFDGFYRRFAKHLSGELEPGVFRKTFLGSVRERSAMFEVLKAIPANYRVAMLSNNVPVLCDRVRDDERMQRIETFLFSNEIGVRKPKPEAFARLSEALGVAPNEIVFIDDSPKNIAACEEYGLHGLYLDNFEGFKKRWQELLPDLPLVS